MSRQSIYPSGGTQRISSVCLQHTVLRTSYLIEDTNYHEREGEAFDAVITAASGTTVVVAAVPGHKINVLGYTIVASGAGTARFTDSDGSLTGAMSLAANGSIVANSDSSLFEGAEGSAISLVTNAGMTGSITYKVV